LVSGLVPDPLQLSDIPDSNIDQLARVAARDMDRVLDLLRERPRP
jgi:hypothetical protein